MSRVAPLSRDWISEVYRFGAEGRGLWPSGQRPWDIRLRMRLGEIPTQSTHHMKTMCTRARLQWCSTRHPTFHEIAGKPFLTVSSRDSVV